jgi:hypothetical protein
MSQGSSPTSFPSYDRTAISEGERTIAISTNGHAAPPPVDTVDPLTRQLRQMYGAIADEPIPAEIETLLNRLRGH